MLFVNTLNNHRMLIVFLFLVLILAILLTIEPSNLTNHKLQLTKKKKTQSSLI